MNTIQFTKPCAEVLARRRKIKKTVSMSLSVVLPTLMIIFAIHMMYITASYGEYAMSHHLFAVSIAAAIILPIITAYELKPWYKLQEDGSGYKMKYTGELVCGYLEIPAEYKEKPVVALGNLFGNPFAAPQNVKSITVPDTVISVHRNCFHNEYLKEICFTGTKAQWADILAKGVCIDTSQIVYCTDGQYNYLTDGKPCE